MSRLFALTVLLAGGFTYVRAQQGAAKAQDNSGIPVFRADTRLVVCHTTVLDKSGHLVTNLPQDAFTVLENDIKQEIRVFRREDIPVSIGLVIDNSGSMRPKRSSVEAAAMALVKDSNPDDEVFIVNFNDTAYIDNPHDKPFLTDMEEMKEALTRIDSRGGTAVRDAIQESIDWLRQAHKEKKVLVVVTDGVDNASDESRNNLEAVVRSARQSDVVIYCVGLLNEEDKRAASRARRELKALTDASGGEAFYPEELSQVDRIAHQVARDIRSQYTIQYTPSNTAMDGTYRRIKVAVRAPGNLTARTRTGYYATPDHAAGPTAPGGDR